MDDDSRPKHSAPSGPAAGLCAPDSMSCSRAWTAPTGFTLTLPLTEVLVVLVVVLEPSGLVVVLVWLELSLPETTGTETAEAAPTAAPAAAAPGSIWGGWAVVTLPAPPD